ncbi:hypothetical protein [Achromobacter xylosoxidans]|nr:hypothetical protein [Achromobacter xylosoxidans]
MILIILFGNGIVKLILGKQGIGPPNEAQRKPSGAALGGRASGCGAIRT